MITYKEISQSHHKAFIIMFKDKWTEKLIEEAKQYNDYLSFKVSSNVEMNEEILLSLVDLNMVMKDAAEELIYQAINDFITDHKRNINNNPYVYISKLDRDGFEAIVNLDISPLVSITDYHNLDVLQPLDDDYESMNHYKERLLNELLEKSEVIVNDDLLQEEMQAAIQSELSRSGFDGNIIEYCKERDMDYNKYMEELKIDTIYRVSVQTLLYEVSSIENIIVSGKDLKHTINNIMEQFKMSKKEVLTTFDAEYIHDRALLELATQKLIDLNEGKRLLN